MKISNNIGVFVTNEIQDILFLKRKLNFTKLALYYGSLLLCPTIISKLNITRYS